MQFCHLQFCLKIHRSHCKQNDLSKTENWVLLLSCFILQWHPISYRYIQPPHQAIHLSPLCPLLKHSGDFKPFYSCALLFIFPKYISPPCPPDKLLVALWNVAQTSLTLGNISGSPKQSWSLHPRLLPSIACAPRGSDVVPAWLAPGYKDWPSSSLCLQRQSSVWLRVDSLKIYVEFKSYIKEIWLTGSSGRSYPLWLLDRSL